MIDSQEGVFQSGKTDGDKYSRSETFGLLKYKNGHLENSGHSNDPVTLSPSSSSIQDEEFTPEYSPLPLKHQQFYQKNVKLQNNTKQYDGEITQRTFKSRPSQPTGNPSIQYPRNNQCEEQSPSMSGIVLSSEVSVHNHHYTEPLEQMQHANLITIQGQIQESRTSRTYQHNQQIPQNQNYYRLRCQELEKDTISQKEKIKSQQKYQQSIVEKLEESSYNADNLLLKNQQLLKQIKSIESELEGERARYFSQQEQMFCQKQHIEHMSLEITMLKDQLEDAELANRLKCRQVTQLQGIIGNQCDKQIKQHQKFCDCILEMVKMCNPPQEKELSLKQAWKWLKQVLDDYMLLKKNQTHRSPLDPRLQQTQSMASSTCRTTNEKRYSSSQMMNIRQSDAAIKIQQDNQLNRSKSREKMVQSDANIQNIQVSQLIKTNRPNMFQSQEGFGQGQSNIWKYNNYDSKVQKENRP